MARSRTARDYEVIGMTSIYVGNLSSCATEDEIKRAFGHFGKVNCVKIIVEQETNLSRGYAFVEMPRGEAAEAAIEAMSRRIVTKAR